MTHVLWRTVWRSNLLCLILEINTCGISIFVMLLFNTNPMHSASNPVFNNVYFFFFFFIRPLKIFDAANNWMNEQPNQRRKSPRPWIWGWLDLLPAILSSIIFRNISYLGPLWMCRSFLSLVQFNNSRCIFQFYWELLYCWLFASKEFLISSYIGTSQKLQYAYRG